MEAIGIITLGIIMITMVLWIFSTDSELCHYIAIAALILCYLTMVNQIQAPDEQQVMLAKHESVGSTEGDKNW